MVFIPLVNERPERFKKLQRAFDKISLLPPGPPRVCTRTWFPLPTEHQAVQKTLKKLTVVRERNKDEQFTHFKRGCINIPPHSSEFESMIAAWPKEAKVLPEPNLSLRGRGSTRVRWIQNCLECLQGSSALGALQEMPRNWRYFEVEPREHGEGDFEKSFPSLRNYPQFTADVNVQCGFWWHDKQDPLEKKTFDALKARRYPRPEDKLDKQEENEEKRAIAKENQVENFVLDSDDEYQNEGEIFDEAWAHPSRIMLVISDEALPGLVEKTPPTFTYSEFGCALAYLDFMHVSEKSALLLITVYGDRAARITEVFWSEAKQKLVFQIQVPMLDLSGGEIEDFNPEAPADPWRLAGWLCCTSEQ